jgi:phospholipase/carboxylesterase
MRTLANSWRVLWLVSTVIASCAPHTPTPSGAAKGEPPRAPPPPANYSAPDTTGWGKAGSLRFLEIIPGGTPRDPRLPMLVMIHGMGDRPHADWLAGFDAGTPVRVIMPRAPTPYFDGFSWFNYTIGGPNDPAALAQGITRAADQLTELLDLLTQQRPTRGRPIVAGFSQGGMLSYALALQHPERMRLALPIAGMLPEPLWPTQSPTRRVPIRSLHGDADTIIDIHFARDLQARLNSLGYDASLEEFPGVDHAISPPMQDRINALLRERL